MRWSGVAQPGWDENFDQAPPAGTISSGEQIMESKGLVRDHWPGPAGHHSTSREGWSTVKNLEAGVATPEPSPQPALKH